MADFVLDGLSFPVVLFVHYRFRDSHEAFRMTSPRKPRRYHITHIVGHTSDEPRRMHLEKFI